MQPLYERGGRASRGQRAAALRRPSGRAIAIAVLAVLVLVAAVLVTVVLPRAAVSVSASSDAAGYPAAQLAGHVASDDRAPVWISRGETVGAAVTMKWAARTRVDGVRLVSAPGAEAVLEGYLRFDDGSSLSVGFTDGVAEVPFIARTVGAVTFVATAAEPGSTAVGLAEWQMTGGGGVGAAGEGPLAAIASASSSASGTSAEALVDSSAVDAGAEQGAVWRAAADDDAPWVELALDGPQEIASLQLHGAAAAGGGVTAARIEFPDGTRIETGAVAPGGVRPSTVAFMPRVADRVRVVLDAEAPELREVAVFARWVEPRPDPADPDGVAAAAAAPDDCAAVSSPSPSTRLEVLCPTPGTSVGATATVVVRAPAGAAVRAVASVPAGQQRGGADALQEVAATTAGADGLAVLAFPTARLSRGPLNVRVEAEGVERSVYAQLVNADGVEPSSSAAAPGLDAMTLVRDDDFDGPLSVTQDGVESVYAATKPSLWGPSEFGEAVFVDPALGTSNLATTDGLLRIRVSPKPASIEDPFGWDREHLGGILSSAGMGGSGFSAQYGYFETRMLGAPGTGTWPAFWMLSSGSLHDGAQSTGEVDAVELYGHAVTSSCTSTHAWVDGENERKRTECVEAGTVEDWALQWHTYGVRILPDSTTFFVDGVRVAEFEAPIQADQPFYFMLDLALGGGWPIDLSPTSETADLYVDYVRVYT